VILNERELRKVDNLVKAVEEINMTDPSWRGHQELEVVLPPRTLRSILDELWARRKADELPHEAERIAVPVPVEVRYPHIG